MRGSTCCHSQGYRTGPHGDRTCGCQVNSPHNRTCVTASLVPVLSARLPHVYRTCGCVVNLPHNHTCGVASLVTVRDYFCVWVQQTRHKIESLPVLDQICDPPILHVLPDVLTYIVDTGMHWWHGKFSVHVSSAILITLRLFHNSCDSHEWSCTVSNNVPVVNSHLEMVALSSW